MGCIYMQPSEEKNVGSKVGYSEKKCISLEDIDISLSILTNNVKQSCHLSCCIQCKIFS